MRTYPSLGVAASSKLRTELGPCHSNRDGDCNWKRCPQKVKYRVGCPLFDWSGDDAAGGTQRTKETSE